MHEFSKVKKNEKALPQTFIFLQYLLRHEKTLTTITIEIYKIPTEKYLRSTSTPKRNHKTHSKNCEGFRSLQIRTDEH